MPDTSWTITTKRHGDLTADAITADWPTATRGSTVLLQLWFDEAGSTDAQPLIVEDGESYTVATAETRPYVRTAGSGTITVNAPLTIDPTAGGLYQLLQYLDYADAAAYGESQSHRPWYHEQLPTAAKRDPTNIESIVLGFNPPEFQRQRGIPGLWGLVVGGADRRNSALTNWQLELEIFVLAERHEYTDHTDLESDLQA